MTLCARPSKYRRRDVRRRDGTRFTVPAKEDEIEDDAGRREVRRSPLRRVLSTTNRTRTGRRRTSYIACTSTAYREHRAIYRNAVERAAPARTRARSDSRGGLNICRVSVVRAKESRVRSAREAHMCDNNF